MRAILYLLMSTFLGSFLNYSIRLIKLLHKYSAIIITLALAAQATAGYAQDCNTTRSPKKVIIDHCILQIDRNNIEGAVYYFHEVNDTSQGGRIIKGAYKNAESVEKILDFVWSFPWPNQRYRCLGYTGIFNEMKSHNDMNSPSILTLSHVINKSIEVGNLGQNEKCFENLQRKIELPIKNFIRSWSSSIRNGEYGQIQEFYKERNLVFASHREEIYKYAYNPDDLENIIKFIRSFNDSEESSIGYTLLLNEMIKMNDLGTPGILTLAYFVKNTMVGKYGNYSNISTEIKNRFEKLKNSLPAGVKSIFWDTTTCIKNEFHDEYLYVVWPFTLMYTEKQVGNNSKWIFEPNDVDSSFKIKNYRTNKYMCAGLSTDVGNQRLVFTAKETRLSCDWFLEPQKTSFWIRNKGYNEYLFATFDEDRHAARTWTKKGRSVLTSAWKITTCRMI